MQVRRSGDHWRLGDHVRTIIVGVVAGSVPSTDANVFPLPLKRGLTFGVAGTSSLDGLVAAQAFLVESVWKLDLASQLSLATTPGGPSITNTLRTLFPTDVVILKSL